MKSIKYCLLTNDVETMSIWHNLLRDETGLRVFKEGMPLLLDLYSKYNIKTTFFFTGYIAKLYPEIVKMVIPYGHEVASHGMSHEKKDGFDVMSLKKQINHLKESKKILENISGQEVLSFRVPALRINNDTATALAEAGYKIDSSIASQRFDLFMSFGGLQKLNWLLAPRRPYRAARGNLFKQGNGCITEVPLSATLLPYVGTTMRMFPMLTSFQRKVLAFEAKVTGKPIVFDFHPNECIDETHEQAENGKRSENIVASLLQDKLRRGLKIKNLGRGALNLYEQQIKYFVKKGFTCVTCKDFVESLV